MEHPYVYKDGDATSFSINKKPTPECISIVSQNKTLLTINPDGTVTSNLDDASDAAKVFVSSLEKELATLIRAEAVKIIRSMLDTVESNCNGR